MRKRIRNPRLTASRRRRRFARVLRQHSPTISRDGTTLTEVLMAILCMGIGVVAVASLFPIALLRSVQATQLTSATILRFDAETRVDLNPEIVTNPDGDMNLTEHTVPFVDRSSKRGKNYLIDPLGWNIIEEDFTQNDADFVGNMPRFHVGAATEDDAEELVMLRDSWVTLYDEIADTNTLTDVTLDMSSDVAAIKSDVAAQIGSGQTLRLVLFHSNGRISETRRLTDAANQISGSTISWPSQRPLPAYNDNVIRVRIEVRERRYTWLLSVRNFTTDPAVPQALVDVVVFFRRSPSVTEETPYALTRVSGRTYEVGTAGDRPFLKKGSFMLDTDTGTWHRIQDVDESADPRRITLERNIPNDITGHRAVFMRGVVEVYPLGTKP